MNILKNKKIIISAGASGIGLATTKICLARGAYVYLCDIDTKYLNKLNKNPLKNKRLFTYYFVLNYCIRTKLCICSHQFHLISKKS